MTREEFKDLIERYLTGQASDSEERLIEDFFRTQERKRSAEEDTISEAMWASIADRIAVKGKKNTPLRSRSFFSRRILVSLSILLVLGIALGLTFVYRHDVFTTAPNPSQWISLRSPNGQKSIITLADGSRIFLNAGSSISYPEVFMPEKREVILSGEAFFEVTENRNQPFIVSTGTITTKVLGTSFNIRSYPNRDISVTVATGKVQVETTSSSGPIPSGIDSTNRVILTANDQATYSSDGKEVTVAQVEIGKYLAWKDNTLLFDDISIEEVAKILERWYNVTIVFDNEQIKSCRINGKYTDQSLEDVLKSIQYMYHVDFVFSAQNKVNLKGKGCKANGMDTS